MTAPARPDTLAEVVEVITQIRPDLRDRPEPVTPHTGLFFHDPEDPENPRDPAESGAPALELDSMEALELLSALEDHFQVELSDTGVRVVDLRTVGDVLDALAKAR
ncbi:acyl carrier protein [Streptomyces sp. NPDC005438]|uniref:acyl carrier protein n=1 Tax=Streptomyces sp. NPDC005438 TaxID=3156880 RepID=UPI0033A0CFF9